MDLVEAAHSEAVDADSMAALEEEAVEPLHICQGK